MFSRWFGLMKLMIALLIKIAKNNPMRKHLQTSPPLINILEKNCQLLVIGFNKLI